MFDGVNAAAGVAPDDDDEDALSAAGIDAAADFHIADAVVSGLDWAAANALAIKVKAIAAIETPETWRMGSVKTPAVLMLLHAAFALQLPQMRAN